MISPTVNMAVRFETTIPFRMLICGKEIKEEISIEISFPAFVKAKA